jgi:peptidyl-prolyl cis-trans isomerase C
MVPERETLATSSSMCARNAVLCMVFVCIVCVACVACSRGTSSGAPNAVAMAEPSASTGADESPVLAELDGRVITLRDFDESLSRQPLALRTQFKRVEARCRLLEDKVRLELLADEARRRGIDRSPEIRDRISELLAEELTNQILTTDAKPGDVSDAEIQAYYDAHAAEFHVREQRSAIVPVFDNRRQADDTLRKASAHPRDEAFFRALVRDLQHNPAAPSVESGFFDEATSGPLPAAVRDAVFDTRAVGDVHPVVATDGAFYVPMLAGIRPALDREVNDVAPLIRERLRAERRTRALSDFVDGLRARGHVSIHGERLGASASPAVAPSASASAAQTE